MFSNSRSSVENGSKSLSHMLNDTSMLREVCKIVYVSLMDRPLAGIGAGLLPI